MEPETAARLRAMDDSTSEEEEAEDVPLGLRRKQLQRHQQAKAQGQQRDRPAQQGQMQAPVRLAAPAGKAPKPTAGSQAAAEQAARAAKAPRGSSQQRTAGAGRTLTGDAGQGASYGAGPACTASKPPLGARASNKPVRLCAAHQLQDAWASCRNVMLQWAWLQSHARPLLLPRGTQEQQYPVWCTAEMAIAEAFRNICQASC